jgi:hypothetical protein
MSGKYQTVEYMLYLMVLSFLIALLFLMKGFAQGAGVWALTKRLNEGKFASLTASYQAIFGRIRSIFFFTGTFSCLILIGSVFLLIPIVWCARFIMGVPIIINEEIPYFDGFRRSRHLSQGILGKLIFVIFIFSLMWMLLFVNFFLGVKLGLELGRIFFNLNVAYLSAFFSLTNGFYLLFLNAVIFILLEPLKVAIITMIYFDARLRREGADILFRIEAVK